MTPEQIEAELVALKVEVANLRAELHKELHLLTWRLLGLMTAQTGLILGAMYYMLTHIK